MIDVEIKDAGPGSSGYLVALSVEPEESEHQGFTDNAVGVLIGALQSNLGATKGITVRSVTGPGRGSLEWDCEGRRARLAAFLWGQFVVTALEELEDCHPETLRLCHKPAEGLGEGGGADAAV